MTYLHDTTRISRRRVLAGLGAVGLASVGAGLGTTGFLSDRETLPADLTAGRLDLKLDYRATYTPGEYQPTDSDGTPYPVGDTLVEATTGEALPMYVVGMAPDLRNADGTVVDNATWSTANLALDACRPLADQLPLDIDDDQDPEVFAGDGERDGVRLDNYQIDYVDGPDGLVFALDDVKPCDRGEATVSFHVCDNPAYVWLAVDGVEAENTRYEPEQEAGDTDDGPFAGGELADFVWVRAFYDPDCSNTLGDDEVVMYEGSLAGFVDATAGGRPLDPIADAGSDTTGASDGGDGDPDPEPVPQDGGGICYDPGTHCIAVEWYLPCDPVQDDGMGFTQLPSDAATTDTPVNGEYPSLADELLATFDLDTPEDLDVNVVQSDSATFTLTMASVQCRHNTANDNPFGTADSEGGAQ